MANVMLRIAYKGILNSANGGSLELDVKELRNVTFSMIRLKMKRKWKNTNVKGARMSGPIKAAWLNTL